MAKQTTSKARSLKKPPSRKESGKTSASRRGKRTPGKKPEAKNQAPSQTQVAASVSPRAQGRRETKQDQLAALLLRDEGATIAQMCEATEWLPHTVRAALTGLKKKGYMIDSDKVGDVRTYRASAPR